MKKKKKYQVYVLQSFANEIDDLLFIAIGYHECSQNIEAVGFDTEFYITRHSKRYPIKLGKALKLVFPYLNESEVSNVVDGYRKKIKGDYYDDIKVSHDLADIYDMYHYCSGTLGSSCMKGRGSYYSDLQRTQEIAIAYIEEIAENDEYVLLGRALLWEAKDLKGEAYKLMDRVYSHNEQSLRSLLQWGRDNGYCVKEEQNHNNSNFVAPDGTLLDKAFKVCLSSSLDEAPYMDTFTYYDDGTHCLYTRDIKGKSLCVLDYTDGTVYANRVCCECCGDSFDSDNEGAYVASTGFVCDDCLERYFVFTYDTQEYVHLDDAYRLRNGDYYASNADLVYCDDIEEYVLIDDDWAYIEDLGETWYNFENAYYHEDESCYYSYPEQIEEEDE